MQMRIPRLLDPIEPRGQVELPMEVPRNDKGKPMRARVADMALVALRQIGNIQPR